MNTDKPELNIVMVTDQGNAWIEIDSMTVANYAGQMTQTAVRTFYEEEAKLEGGLHPRRWFSLIGPDERGVVIGKVALCALPEGVTPSSLEIFGHAVECHTTGHRNKSPYPEFAEEIAALSEFICIDLPPNHAGVPIQGNSSFTPSSSL